MLKKFFTLSIFIFVFLLFAPEISAADYYISPSGSDSNSGSLSSPWRTLEKAGAGAEAGDTVYIREGVYNEMLHPQNSGTANAYITFVNYNNEEVTIDGTGIALQWQGLIDVQDVSYIKVVGLRVINSTDDGIYVKNADHVEIRDNYTYDTYQSGIGVWSSTNVIVDGNEIEFANNGGHNENLSVDGSDNIIISNNNVHHGFNSPYGGEGINMKNGTTNTKVFGNVVHDIPKLAFGVDAWQKHTYNIEIYNNIAYNARWGFILESEQGGLAEDLWVYNNLAYNIDEAGYALPEWGIAGPVDKVYYINNVAYDCRYGFWSRHANVSNVVIRNNIFNQIRSAPAINLYSGTENEFTIDYNLLTDALFIDASSANFRLQPGSPAIDAGSLQFAPDTDFDGNARPQGAGVDIGAFEYGSANRPGDANADGKVDGIDYVIWLSHYNQNTANAASDGDFNSDNTVDGIDYVIWLQNYN